nr:retrovirus-related Pol polyprotein from transposon TNT 1-94 [Tanacetum cinerariifolium]
MANLSEDIQCAGSDTRPPMLDRTDFVSWQQRIRLYCQGKENGVIILKSIDEGPFQMGIVRETLAEGTKGGPHLGPERPQVYSDLSPEEKDRMQLNSKFVKNMLPEWGRFVTSGNNPRGGGAVGYGGAQNRVGNANLGHARQIKCYNYNSIGHIARNYTQPKRPQNSNYFKDKMLLIQAQENRVALDEEQLLFLAGNVFQADDCDAFDSDVDEAPTAQTMFMANLSSVDPVYDEARPSYDSKILSEEHFEGIQKALTKELKEMKDVFEELDAEVAQNVVDKKHDEIERKNLLIENDNLIAECLSKEVFYVATNSELNIFTEMHVAHTIVEARCLELEAELSNFCYKIHNDNHNESVNRFSNLEVHHLNLQLKYQNVKDSFGNNPPTPAKDTPDFDSVFVIGKMQASFQGKDNVIKQLKKQISH